MSTVSWATQDASKHREVKQHVQRAVSGRTPSIITKLQILSYIQRYIDIFSVTRRKIYRKTNLHNTIEVAFNVLGAGDSALMCGLFCPGKSQPFTLRLIPVDSPGAMALYLAWAHPCFWESQVGKQCLLLSF